MLRTMALLAVLATAALPAQAQIQSYDFNGVIDSGEYINELFNGTFSFDDVSLTNLGTEDITLDSLNLNLLGSTFDQNNFLFDSPVATFEDGVFAGINWSYDAFNPEPDIQFSFISGFFDTSDAFFAYDTGFGSALSGTADVSYSTSVAAVPEPQTYAMLLAGLGLIGYLRKRKAA